MKQLSFLYKTHDHITGLILRVTLALVILPHGCQLLFGWFDGPGFDNSMNNFTQAAGLPWIIAFSVIMIQFFGMLLILLGFMSRPMAFAMTILFIGMIITSHWEHGFFMNWMGTQKGEGFEFHLLGIGLSLALLINGSGAYSFDAALTKQLGSQQSYYDPESIYL